MKARNRLLVMSWGHLLNDGAANYLPGVLPAVLVSLHQPKSQAGVVMGVLLVGQGVQPLIGWFSDEAGGKAVTLAGLCGSTLAGALLGLAPHYWALLGLLVMVGLANSCFHPQALAGVRSLADQRRGLPTAVFLVGGEIGRGVWPLLAGVVVRWLGLPYLWVLGGPALVSLPLLFMSFPSLPARHPETEPIRWRKHWKPLTRLIVFTTLRVMLIFMLVTFLPLWWKQEGRGGLLGGAALVTTLYMVGIFGNAGAGHLADRLGFRAVAVAASLLTIVLMAGFVLVSGPAQWVVLALLGIALFATLPISIALGQDILPENPSLGSGIALGLCNGLAAAAVMVLGLLADRIGAAGMLWLTTGLSVPAAAAAFFLPTPED